MDKKYLFLLHVRIILFILSFSLISFFTKKYLSEINNLWSMDKFITGQITKKASKNSKLGKPIDPIEEVRTGLAAFRDWAFTNPRIALLVMERLKADTQNATEKMKKYYQSTVLAKTMLDRAVQAGFSNRKDTMLDASLCIAVLWGCY
jgi:hypothetical protein